MATLLCVGEVIVEMVANEISQSAEEVGIWTGPYPSGAPAILADQASLCGVDVRLLGSVGKDSFGRACLRRLREDGVDLSLLNVDELRPTGVAFVSYAEDGSRSFVFHIAETASGYLAYENYAEVLAGVDCVHIMGSTAFSDRAIDALEELSDAAVGAGIAISFDPNLRPEMLTHPRFMDSLKRILRRAQIVLASEGELAQLLGLSSDQECIEKLLAGSAEMVVLKKGDEGALLYLRGEEVVRASPKKVREVDATGAGDCFGGTFLALLLQGVDPRDALGVANAAGAHAVTMRGPMSGNVGLDQLRAFAAARA